MTTIIARISKLEAAAFPERLPLYAVCGIGESCYWIGSARFESLAEVESKYPDARVIGIQLKVDDSLLAGI